MTIWSLMWSRVNRNTVGQGAPPQLKIRPADSQSTPREFSVGKFCEFSYSLIRNHFVNGDVGPRGLLALERCTALAHVSLLQSSRVATVYVELQITVVIIVLRNKRNK